MSLLSWYHKRKGKNFVKKWKEISYTDASTGVTVTHHADVVDIYADLYWYVSNKNTGKKEFVYRRCPYSVIKRIVRRTERHEVKDLIRKMAGK